MQTAAQQQQGPQACRHQAQQASWQTRQQQQQEPAGSGERMGSSVQCPVRRCPLRQAGRPWWRVVHRQTPGSSIRRHSRLTAAAAADPVAAAQRARVQRRPQRTGCHALAAAAAALEAGSTRRQPQVRRQHRPRPQHAASQGTRLEARRCHPCPCTSCSTAAAAEATCRTPQSCPRFLWPLLCMGRTGRTGRSQRVGLHASAPASSEASRVALQQGRQRLVLAMLSSLSSSQHRAGGHCLGPAVWTAAAGASAAAPAQAGVLPAAAPAAGAATRRRPTNSSSSGSRNARPRVQQAAGPLQAA